jgi:hypothetical protein
VRQAALLVEFDDGGLGIGSQLSGGSAKGVRCLQGMAPLNPAMALTALPDMAVFEVTPDYVMVRCPGQGTCVCTNHFCTDELKPFMPLNLFRTYDRYTMLEQTALSRKKLGLDDLHRSLDAVREEEETIQTMIFEPATLRLHLAIGRCPASAGEMKTLDLAPLFQAMKSPANWRP